MQYSEFIDELENNGTVLVARVSSGHSFCGELASATSITPNYVTLKTTSGTRVRVKDVYGRCEVAGKYKDYFVASTKRIESPDFFELPVD